LATGSDDTRIIIWEERIRPKEFGSSEVCLNWAETKVLMGHGKEVYDLRWSSDSVFLFSASLDFSIIVWSVEKGKILGVFAD
jgi:WD40 repeat protein